MTSDDRYGPYGFGEDLPNYNRSRVEWDKLNWAKLQDDCFVRNRPRFRDAAKMTVPSQLHKPEDWKVGVGLSKLTNPPRDRRRSTGRTAIVVRTWDCYDYTPENMHNLRSLIVETALNSGGEYAVYLLVHIKDDSRKIFESKKNYEAALRDTLPPELRSIGVLFDTPLLESWYPKVGDHA